MSKFKCGICSKYCKEEEMYPDSFNHYQEERNGSETILGVCDEH